MAKVGLLPRLTLMGVLDYASFAIGATVAFGLLTPLYSNLESNLRKNGGN